MIVIIKCIIYFIFIAIKTEFLQLNEILEEICIAANLPLPKLYVIESNPFKKKKIQYLVHIQV